MRDITTWKQLLKQEAIEALTKKPIITYSSDRVRVWRDAFLVSRDLPTQPQKYAAALSYFLAHISIPIDEKDVLVGRMVEKSFTEEEEAVFVKTYMAEPGCYSKPDFITDGGHCSLCYEDLFEKGLPGLLSEAEQWLSYYQKNGSESQIDFAKAAVRMYESLILYIRRSADACFAAGKNKQAEVLNKLAKGAPDSFFAAMQLYWTVILIFCAYICYNPTLALGRPDLFLYDLYRRDVDEGRLTQEEASLIIADFYAKNNLIMGRGEHQMGETYDPRHCTGWHRILAYDAPQYLILSGTDPKTGKTVANELTELFLLEIQPGYKNPVIEFRYTRGFAAQHRKLWLAFVEKLSASASAMVYNDIPLIPMYQKAGIPFELAASYEHYGCNWPTLPGRDLALHRYQGSVCDVMNHAIHTYAEGAEHFDRESFLSHLFQTYYQDYRQKAAEIREREKNNDPNSKHIRLYSCFSRDNIEKAGLHYENKNIIINLGTICSAIDMACGVEYLCGEQGISPKKLMEVCDKDFYGEPYLLALCRRAPKAGDGEALSNQYIEKIPRLIIEAAETAMTDLPTHCHLRFCTEYDNGHIEIGRGMGATPDGRRKGMPVSQNTQPANGSARKGLTAMLSAMTHMPFNRLASGAMNVTVDPGNFAGDEGREKLAKILEVYLEKGGMQLQITALSRDKLQKARENPDAYRDLMVRITGYSAVFVDLSLRAQEEIMNRDRF